MAVYLTFDVMNQGSRASPAGVSVTLYIDGAAVQTVRTSRSLFPGQLEHFSVSWPLPAELNHVPFDIRVSADDPGDGSSEFNECDNGGEDNNSAALDDMICGIET